MPWAACSWRTQPIRESPVSLGQCRPGALSGHMNITLSVVSHGQRDIALRMLQDILRLMPPDVAEMSHD